MPILPQPIDNPDAMAERLLELERQKMQTKRSSLSGPIDPSPALLNPYSLELVGTGAGNTNTPPPFLPHALGGEGSPHTGFLYDAQGPQFALLNGSRNYSGHLLPSAPDTYTLGTRLLPWQSLYASEISSTIFRRYEQFLISGIYSVVHGSGKFSSAITPEATQIDFGQTMTPDDIVVIRADNNGSPQVEYMQVGVLVSGTTYYVTRNLDGSGANAWSAGTVYMIQGTTGDGWIDLDATISPKLSLIKKTGSLYNEFAEMIRIGDLNGGWGFTVPTWGAAFGEFASGKPNLLIEPGTLRLRNYDQDVIKLTGTTASFENFITLGTNGGIRQGTGTWGSSFTGTAMWNATGVMNIGGWNAGVKQWWGGSDGIFRAGLGDIALTDRGIFLTSGQPPTGYFSNSLNWRPVQYVVGEGSPIVFGISCVTTYEAYGDHSIARIDVDDAYSNLLITCMGNEVGSAEIHFEADSFRLNGNSYAKIDLYGASYDGTKIGKIVYTAPNGHFFTGSITAGYGITATGVRTGIISLADDAATSFVPASAYGAILIAGNGADSYGLFVVNSTSGGIVSNFHGSGTVATTGALTNGTTNGIDTKFNISAVSGTIYLKNRLGVARTVIYLCL